MSVVPDWRALVARFDEPRHLIGAALLRSGLALLVLYQLLGHWTLRRVLWGPHGLYPFWLFQREKAALGPSLLAVSSEVGFELVYALCIAVAVAYLVGWQTRWTAVWFCAVVWSLQVRSPVLLSGGDTLVRVMLPFLLCLDSGAYLSVDSGWRRPGDPPPATTPTSAQLHNLGLLGIVLQLALFYGFAGFYKLLGTSWPAGTAVCTALQLPEFHRPGLVDALCARPALAAAATWGTVAFELAVPLLLCFRRTRWLVVALAIPFHAAIGWTMGLVLFSAQALVFELVLLDDRSYERLTGWLRRVAHRQPAAAYSSASR